MVSVDREEMCDYGLMKSYYQHLKRILDREVKTANFFVERVHRAPWNLCDQYVSSIIEVITCGLESWIEKDTNDS